MESFRMYITIFVIVVVLLITCVEVNRQKSLKDIYLEPQPIFRPYGIESMCIDGVKYYVIHGLHEVSLTPAFNQDGTLKTCKKEPVPMKGDNI